MSVHLYDVRLRLVYNGVVEDEHVLRRIVNPLVLTVPLSARQDEKLAIMEWADCQGRQHVRVLASTGHGFDARVVARP